MLKLKPLVTTLLFAATIASFGCVENPLYQMWYRKEWQQDEKYGATFRTKLDELAELRDGADALSPAEQTRLATQMSRVIASDPSPLYRVQLVRTLAEFETPVAAEGLKTALKDDDANVRVAACEAWSRRGGEQAVQVLAGVVGSDTDLDVRLAATRELAKFPQQSAVTALGLALNDSDPALQYRAVQSLKAVTGQELGDDVPAWREYIASGRTITRDEPSVAERLRNLF